MGDLITQTSGGTLRFAPKVEFDRVLSSGVEPHERAKSFAALARLNTLYMVARAGSGHLGGSFSGLDVVTWLHLEELQAEPEPGPLDLYFSSKGHDAPGLYAVLLGLGRLPFDLLHQLRRLGGLPGHPDVATPGIVTNTGSLGMGISKAKGLLHARRLRGLSGRVFVMTGDGELQEGQIWESLVSAASRATSELTVVVDHNQLQSDRRLDETSPLGDIAAKFRAFGWYVDRADGHDFAALQSAFLRVRAVTDRPQVIIADTVKGKGVSFMEAGARDSDTDFYRFHSGAPGAEDYARACDELLSNISVQFERAGLSPPDVQTAWVDPPARTARVQRLISAYEVALEHEVAATPNAVVLDADLLVDTGQLAAQRRFPNRHVECGIAEMDMVSQAGGMALGGLLPICHSFACFLSARANEHLYNNATERTKIVYVASLAGLLPGGPGHSHQAVRDIASVGGIPNLLVLEPATESDVSRALHFALHETELSVYLRLVSVPWELPDWASVGSLVPGIGRTIRDGDDVMIFAYGPVLLGEALRAAEQLATRRIGTAVVNLPWLNRVDDGWLARTIGACDRLLFLDNHYEHGGQGDLLSSALTRIGGTRHARAQKLGLRELPVSGRHEEVLAHHRLDARGIVEVVLKGLEDGARSSPET